MREAIERGEAALGSLRSDRFVVVVVIIIIIIVIFYLWHCVKSSSLQTYISTSHKKIQWVLQSLENFDSIYNPELMIFVKSNVYLILMIVTENIREETFSCNRRRSWMNHWGGTERRRLISWNSFFWNFYHLLVSTSGA